MRASIFGTLAGRLYIGAVLACVSIYVLQTAPLRPHPAGEPINFAAMKPAFTDGNKNVLVYVEARIPTAANTAWRNALTFEIFHVERGSDRYAAGENRSLVGNITNQSPSPRWVRLKLRFQNRDKRDIGIGDFADIQLRSYEHIRIDCPLRGAVTSAQLLVLDNEPEPIVPEFVSPQMLFFSSLVLFGFALHLGLASWLRPNGWEDRLRNHSLK